MFKMLFYQPCLFTCCALQILLVTSQGITGEENSTRISQGSSVTSVTTTDSPTTTILNNDIEIDCAATEIKVRIKSPHPDFNGMIYPQVSLLFSPGTTLRNQFQKHS